VYLNVDQSQESNLNRGFETQLRDMLARTGSDIHGDEELQAFAKASEQIQGFVAHYNVKAVSLAAVFDESDGFFWGKEVDFPVQNRVHWGREACVEPLAAALDEREPLGIVLLDKANLRLFTMSLGRIKERLQKEFDRKKLRHTKTIGMDHLESAARAQHKADEQVRLNFRRITKEIDAIFEQDHVRRIILAGSPVITAELRKVLPKRLASRVIGTFDLAINATADEVRAGAVPIAEEFERETERTLVEDLATSAAKSTNAVVGLGHTLHAINQQRVWQLVYAGGFHAPGYECGRCGALYSMAQISCSSCGSGVSKVEDVVERAVDHTLRIGAKIEVVRGDDAEGSLINAGGIGAFLRTRKPTVRAS
jgi:peptide subunit release factor 1 (eRF1)